MPHLILEHSSNLDNEINTPDLFEKLHNTILETKVFPIGGIRSRAHRCDQFRVADGDPELGFVHLILKIGHGRDLETRKSVGEKVFSTLTSHLKPIFDRRYIGISFEMIEIHPDLNFKQNNIHQRFKT